MESIAERLKRLHEEGESFTFANFSSGGPGTRDLYGGEDTPKWLAWKTRATNIVQQALEETSAPVALVRRAAKVSTRGNGKEQFLKQKSLILAALESARLITLEDVFGESRRPKTGSTSRVLSSRVFVVHGHDHSAKTELEIFLASLGIDPVVLHRQPDQGQTLIEKFEKHSDVGFAFILLTPDDIAYPADQEASADVDRKKEFQARPNVIFESGYFVGKLGRDRVCCLIKGDITRPSDIGGLMYKEIPSSIEDIGYAIIRELKAAGYTITI